MLDDAYGVGIAMKDVEITFPLSSHVLLYLCWSTARSGQSILTEAEVEEFNRRTIIMADSLIFALAGSDSALQTVAKYRKFSAGTDYDIKRTAEATLHLARFRPVLANNRYG